MTEADDLVRAIEEEVELPYKLITEAYEKAPKKRIRAALLVEYRCQQRGCLLFHTWRSREFGLCFYVPPYQLSASRNDSTTNPKAREERTTDGERSWQGHGGPLEDFRDSGGASFMLSCDHTQVHRRCEEIFADIEAATPGAPTRRFL
jgi:hypothetical protein